MLCAECKRRNEAARERYLRRKAEQAGTDYIPRPMRDQLGLCYICGDTRTDGTIFCADCLERQRQKAAYMRTHIDYKKHPFRAMNDEIFRPKK